MKIKKLTRKQILRLLPVAALALLIPAGCFHLFLHAGKDPRDGTATGKSALISMKELCGESRIEVLADLKEAAKAENPEEFLCGNSIYVLDEEALDKYAETCAAGAEATARANGVTTEQLILGEWGYESMEDYREKARAEAEDFVKKRLAIYEAARKMHIRIREKEYAALLPAYAARFGYNTTEEFTYACIPSSIAIEMLYDKTVSHIRESKASQ